MDSNRRFHLKVREHFFTVRVTEYWHGLPREVERSSSLDLDMVLGNQL